MMEWRNSSPADKIIMTGNPVRQNLLANKQSREEAVSSFGFNPEKKTILILGGSLGARTINQTLIAVLDTIKVNGDIQFIWQTGKYISSKSKMLLLPQRAKLYVIHGFLPSRICM